MSGALGRVEVDRTEEIVKWTNRIGTFLDNVKEVFGYFSKYFSGDPPLDARKLVEELKLSSKA